MIKKIVMVMLVSFCWWQSRSFIRAQKIECYTQYGICSGEIYSRLDWLADTPLLFPLPRDRVSHQLSGLTYIKSARVYRRLPVTLVVSIDLRKPLGTIGPRVLGVKAVADEEGVIIGHQENSGLPQLISVSEVSDFPPGRRLDRHQSQALVVLSEIGRVSGNQVLGRLQDSLLEVVLSDTTQVLIDLSHQQQNWISTLQSILYRSKIQAKVPKTIDLRFSNPILKY